MGVRRMEHWLELGSRCELVGRKWDILDQHHDQAIAYLPYSQLPAQELLEHIVQQLTHLGVLASDGIVVEDRECGNIVDVRAYHPIEAAGRLVGEDLCIMELQPELGDGYFLTSASVCFPSRWDLTTKIGTSLQAIHQPVPGYGSIAGSADRLFDALSVERPVQRVNWTLLNDPELFQPTSATRTDLHELDPETFGERIFLRVERQTIVRLPRTQAIVFTIGTSVVSLAELGPHQRRDLANSLAEVSDPTQRYKGWLGLIPVLQAWAGDSSSTV